MTGKVGRSLGGQDNNKSEEKEQKGGETSPWGIDESNSAMMGSLWESLLGGTEPTETSTLANFQTENGAMGEPGAPGPGDPPTARLNETSVRVPGVTNEQLEEVVTHPTNYSETTVRLARERLTRHTTIEYVEGLKPVDLNSDPRIDPRKTRPEGSFNPEERPNEMEWDWTQGKVPEWKQDNLSPIYTDPELASQRPQYDGISMEEVPQYHVILEQLAHRFAYNDEGVDLEKMGGGLEGIGYELIDVYRDPHTGFQVSLFSPTVNNAPVEKGENSNDPVEEMLHPVIAFRGSDFESEVIEKDATEDANIAGIGTFQFAMNEANILAMLDKAIALGKGNPDVVGHSLGGALAQLAAARYGGMVHDIITFQAPGIAAEEAKQVDSDPNAHHSTHYRMGGDLVSSAGEQMTEGDITTFYESGIDNHLSHMHYPLEMLNSYRANSGENNVSAVNHDFSDDIFLDEEEENHNAHDVGSVQPLTVLNPFLTNENTRKIIGFHSAAVRDKSNLAEVWRNCRPGLKEWAESQDFTDEEAYHKVESLLKHFKSDDDSHGNDFNEDLSRLIEQGTDWCMMLQQRNKGEKVHKRDTHLFARDIQYHQEEVPQIRNADGSRNPYQTIIDDVNGTTDNEWTEWIKTQ